MGLKKIEIELLTLEKAALEEEIEELKGYKEAYLRLYSDLYDIKNQDSENFPLNVEILLESYGRNYKYLNQDF